MYNDSWAKTQPNICIQKRYDISDIMRVKGGEYKQPAVCLPFSLGVCHDNGKGVQQDKAEAVQRYRKDAEQAVCARHERHERNICNMPKLVAPDHQVRWCCVSTHAQ